jgi:membrane-associated phospholipid phosphatase
MRLTALYSPWAWLPPAIMLALVAGIHATGANHAVFLWLNHGGHVVGDVAWFHLTMLGDGAVALTLVLPWIRRAPGLFWAALVAAMVAALWTQVTKQLIDVPRPLTVFGDGAFHLAGPAFRHVSFPSGHAAAAAALAGILILGVEGHALWRVALLGLAVLVGVSRIMVGVHWPLDVLWGMLGGWLGAWSGLALQARRGWRTAGWGGIVAGVVLMAVAASLLVSHHIGMPAVMPAQRFLATVCLVWGAWELRGLARLHAAATPAAAPGAARPYPAQAPPWHAGLARAAWAKRLHPLRLRWWAGRMQRRRRDG